MWKTAWQPSTPRRIASASPRSPSTISASSPEAFSGRRASTTTSSPRSLRRCTTRDPMKPVPPVTKALTAGHRIPVTAPGRRRRHQDAGRDARGAMLETVQRSENGDTRRARQRALTIGVAPGEPDLPELRELLRTAGVAVTGELVQRRDRPDPDRYFGRGKLAELKQAVKEADANLVAVDDELLPRQERNLEEELGMPVIDRTAIILDIFADHARSAEGKLQVELAQLEYNLARMRGLWTHLERLGAGRMDGGIGTRGPGESQIETDRRLARDRITALRRQLRRVERNRAVMRARRERAALPSVSLAGYTNVGKSTLLNALTGAGVGVGERLFHTLDPTTRAFEHDGRRYLMTDTVGFIRKLPHQLVEAFKATLEETVLADLILHVVDGSEPEEDRADSIGAADATLEEIGAGGSARLLVMNKIDLLDDDAIRALLVGERDAIAISAATGEGIDELRDRIETAFAETLEPVELLVPYSAGGGLSGLHRIAGAPDRGGRPGGGVVKG